MNEQELQEINRQLPAAMIMSTVGFVVCLYFLACVMETETMNTLGLPILVQGPVNYAFAIAAFLIGDLKIFSIILAKQRLRERK